MMSAGLEWKGIVDEFIFTFTSYRIGSIKTPGFYFSKWVFGWGSIDILPAWGCNWDGVLLIDQKINIWKI